MHLYHLKQAEQALFECNKSVSYLCFTWFFYHRSRQFFILTNNTKVMDIEDYSNGCLSVEFRHLVKQMIVLMLMCHLSSENITVPPHFREIYCIYTPLDLFDIFSYFADSNQLTLSLYLTAAEREEIHQRHKRE